MWTFTRRSPRAVVGVVVVGLAVVALLVARAILAAPAPKLIWGGGEMSAGSPNVAGAPYTFGDMDPCVNRGSVTVTKITSTQSAGVEVSAWGGRPNPFEHGVSRIGAEDGGGKIATVVQAGFQTGPRVVHNLCSGRADEKDGYEFAIELRRTGAATGWAHGLTVTYRSRGGTHTLHLPLNYVQCGNTKPSYPDPRMAGLC
jgi:hypothetical protein